MAKIDFLGKGDVAGHHLSVPFHTLKADKGKSIGDASLEDNLIIQGDNLLALKALLPRYAGKVKCVYIDPPYNTGKEGWVYNDKNNAPLIKDWLGKVVNSEDQTRHDKWLCMMFPRLQLLKELLAEDGVIFISIDDNEQHRLRFIMDEVFGEDNFMANIIWQKKYAPASDAKYFSDNHDFVTCYAKSRANGKNNGESWKRHLLPRTEKQDKLYKYDDKDGRGPWQSGDLSVKTYSPEYDYPIVNPNTGNRYNPPQGTCWRTSKQKMHTWLEQDRVFFPSGGKSVPRLKRYLSEVQQGIVPLTIWTHSEVGHTDGARKLLKGIFSEQLLPFDNPKALGLLQRIFTIAADKNAIILDSFAGSGTTAHAVLALNKEDGGKRKFILVECEDYADNITAERVRRVIKGVPSAKDEALKKGLGGSFTYATLGNEIDHEKILSGESMPSWSALARHVFWLATGKTLDKEPKENKDFLVGKHKKDSVYLLYKPDIGFLQSNKAVLIGDVADKLGEQRKQGERILYYAAAAYVSQKDMDRLGIVFCQLPWAITKQTLKE